MKKLHQSKIIQEFKTFISRGNVIDMAVGIIIGGAFGKIVSSLVSDIVMPLIGILIGGVDFTHLAVTIPNHLDPESPIHLAYGNFIQNVIDFLAIAASIFFFIRLVNKANEKAVKLAKKVANAEEKEADKKEAAEKTIEEKQTELLKEIRDALVKKDQKKSPKKK